MLSDTALDNFDKYAVHLVERNKQMNLTGITEPDEIVIKHFVDSLKFFEYVDVAQGASIIDVGTGAGFPGLPLLLAREDIALTLMDSLNKRLVFLSEVLEMCDLQAELVHARAEDAGQEACFRETYDFATARAVFWQNTASPLLKSADILLHSKAQRMKSATRKTQFRHSAAKFAIMFHINYLTATKEQ